MHGRIITSIMQNYKTEPSYKKERYEVVRSRLSASGKVLRSFPTKEGKGKLR